MDSAPKLSRIVVAVDPAVTGGAGSDECGIVVVGAVTEGPVTDWRAYVLEDASVRGGPLDWARAAIAAMERHGAERLVAEVNQGGDLVESVLRQVDPGRFYRGARVVGPGERLRLDRYPATAVRNFLPLALRAIPRDPRKPLPAVLHVVAA